MKNWTKINERISVKCAVGTILGPSLSSDRPLNDRLSPHKNNKLSVDRRVSDERTLSLAISHKISHDYSVFYKWEEIKCTSASVCNHSCQEVEWVRVEEALSAWRHRLICINKQDHVLLWQVRVQPEMRSWPGWLSQQERQERSTQEFAVLNEMSIKTDLSALTNHHENPQFLLK